MEWNTDIKFLSRATFWTRRSSDVCPLAICMAFQSKMALLASDLSPESKCFLFRLLMADREHKKQQVKGKEPSSDGRHFKSQNWACFVLLSIKPEESSLQKTVSVVPHVNTRLHVCEHTCSWSLLSVAEHTVPPEQLSLKWHYCHPARGHAACPALQAPRHAGFCVHTGTVLTKACKAGFAPARVACLHVQIHAQWHTCALVAQVLLNVHAHTAALYLHGLGRVPFSLSLFSSLNGKRLSAVSFCQQLGDTFLQLAAICFNYVY